MSVRCPVCDRIYDWPSKGMLRRPSRDHIIPRAWGGQEYMNGLSNLRVMCQECNSLRAMCGHCLGALAALRAVSEVECVVPGELARKWFRPAAPRPST